MCLCDTASALATVTVHGKNTQDCKVRSGFWQKARFRGLHVQATLVSPRQTETVNVYVATWVRDSDVNMVREESCFRTGGRRRPGSDSSRRGLVVVCLCDLEA